MKIFGVAGTLNAGKDILSDVLAEKYGLLHMSTSDMIRLMKKREFGDSPKALLTRNDPYINILRNKNGSGFLVDEAYSEWEKNKTNYPGGFIASAIRAVGEAEKIHELGGKVVFVDADPKIRYKRSQVRQRDENEKGRSFEEFMATERSEIEVDQEDKSVQNLGAMKRMADVRIENNYNSVEEFQREVLAFFKKHL